MITNLHTANSVRMGSSMPQYQHSELEQLSSQPRLSSQSSPSMNANIQHKQQAITDSLGQLQAVRNDNSATNKLTTGSRVLTTIATTLKNGVPQEHTQQQIKILESMARHESRMAHALLNLKYKSSGEQDLKSRNAIELKGMMLDLGSPDKEIAKSAQAQLKALGVSLHQIESIRQKVLDELKIKSTVRFTGKSLEQLLNETAELIQGSNNSAKIRDAIAVHDSEANHAIGSSIQSEIRFGNLEPERDYWYEMLKIQERKERCAEIDDSVNRAREERNLTWKIHSEHDLENSQQQLVDSQQHLANVIQQAGNVVPSSSSLQTAGANEVMTALNRVSLGRGYPYPPIAPTQFTEMHIPSQVQFDRTWFNQLSVPEKKAIFQQQWTDLPDSYKTDLSLNPEHFHRYFPNFTDSINTISTKSEHYWYPEINTHLQTDIDHFSDFFTSLFDTLN